MPVTQAAASPPAIDSLEIIRSKELQRLVPFSTVTIWKWERAGRFPRRIQLGPHSIGWRRVEVLAWLANRPFANGSSPRAPMAASAKE